MSFSFSVIAKTAALALAMSAEKLAEVEQQQPVHAADIPTIKKVIELYVDLAGEPAEGHELVLGVNGSVCFSDGQLTQLTGGVNVHFRKETTV